jgi:hypothetical protein
MGKTNYDKIKNRFQQRQKAQGDIDDRWWKPTEGRHRFRILPPPDSFDAWYMEYGVHYGLTTAEGNFETITCPRLTVKKPCPICEFTRGLWRTGFDKDKDLARKIGGKERAVSNVLVYPPSTQQKAEVKLWGYGTRGGTSVMEQLEEHCMGQDGTVVPIDDPIRGMNMKLNVTMKATEKGTFPNYMVTPELPPGPLADKNVLTNLHDFVKIIHEKVKSYDEIRTILLGTNPEADGGHVATTSTTPAEETVEPSEQAPASSVTVGADEEVIEPINEPEVKHGKTSEGSGEARPSQSDLIQRAKAQLAKRSAAK